MDDLKFVAEKFNINHTKDYRTSIQLNQDGFSVFVADHNRNILKILHRNFPGYKKMLDNFKEDNSLFEIANLSFSKIEFLLNSNDFTLIPIELYNEKDEINYQKLNFPIGEYDLIKTDFIHSQGLACVYNINPGQQKIISYFKNSPEISHINKPYLSYLKKIANGNKFVSAYYAGGNLLLTFSEENKIFFHNIFKLSNKEDSIYYILNLYNNIDSLHKGIALFISGLTTNEEETIMNLLRPYIQNIKDIDSRLPFELAGNYNENYFINLLESTGCV